MFLSKVRIRLYNFLVDIIPNYYKLYGAHIGEGVKISRKALIETNINPQGVHIQSFTRITGGVKIITHDACRGLKADVHIGKNCFIGMNCLILPGVTIGDEVVIGAGSVVCKDIPSNCIAAGNPAKVIRMDIRCGKYGKIIK